MEIMANVWQHWGLEAMVALEMEVARRWWLASKGSEKNAS